MISFWRPVSCLNSPRPLWRHASPPGSLYILSAWRPVILDTLYHIWRLFLYHLSMYLLVHHAMFYISECMNTFLYFLTRLEDCILELSISSDFPLQNQAGYLHLGVLRYSLFWLSSTRHILRYSLFWLSLRGSFDFVCVYVFPLQLVNYLPIPRVPLRPLQNPRQPILPVSSLIASILSYASPLSSLTLMSDLTRYRKLQKTPFLA